VLSRKIEKLQLRLGGIREMKRLPELLVVVDTIREATAVKEANILGIPVLALADTNSDPDSIDFIVPANDDAVRAIKLLISTFAEAVIEGQGMRKADDLDQEQPMVEGQEFYNFEDKEAESDETYLGASTLAKLRDANLFTDEEEVK